MNHEKCDTAENVEAGSILKMREALGKILWCLEWMFDNTDDKSVQSHLAEPISLAKSALATPSEPIGNSAKMREALSDACYAMFNFLKTRYGGFEEMAKALDKAKAALAAPLRNCDRFVDELDAQIEFLNDVWLISVTKDTMLEGDKFENWTEEMKSRYAKWLFAEAKGECDGSTQQSEDA